MDTALTIIGLVVILSWMGSTFFGWIPAHLRTVPFGLRVILYSIAGFTILPITALAIRDYDLALGSFQLVVVYSGIYAYLVRRWRRGNRTYRANRTYRPT